MAHTHCILCGSFMVEYVLVCSLPLYCKHVHMCVVYVCGLFICWCPPRLLSTVAAVSSAEVSLAAARALMYVMHVHIACVPLMCIPVCVICVMNDIYELYTICVCICYVLHVCSLCYVFLCMRCMCACVASACYVCMCVSVACVCCMYWYACVGCIYVCSMFFTDCTRIAVSSAKVNLATWRVSASRGELLEGRCWVAWTLCVEPSETLHCAISPSHQQ